MAGAQNLPCPREFHLSVTGRDMQKQQKKKVSTVVAYVCALLNSDGGSIKLPACPEYDDKEHKKSEQALISFMSLTSVVDYVKSRNDGGVRWYEVRKCNRFITSKYNLFLPTSKQISPVSGVDPVDEIYRMLTRNVVEDPVVKGSHEKIFIFGERSDLEESEVVQFKSLKTERSKTKKFSDRVVDNRLCSYISGFANHRGGHIYYGINDEGKVTGEKLTRNDIKKVEETVSKMVEQCRWNKEKPEKGTHWEVFIQEVKDAPDSTYVVVVFVASYFGGVFTADPESYYYADGEAKIMNFNDWWRKFENCVLWQAVRLIEMKRRVTWSSQFSRDLFVKLSERLVDHRDDGNPVSFNKLCELAVSKYKEQNGELIVKAGEITMAYKSSQFEKAQVLLKEFKDLLIDSKDRSIFQARYLLSECLVARSMKNYEESFEKSEQAIQLAENNPVGLCMLWLYMESAMNASCLASQNQKEPDKYGELKKKALLYLDIAVNVAKALADQKIPFRSNDFLHKVCIYKAWVLLNCSVTGEKATIVPNEHDLAEAEKELSLVSTSDLKGNSLTKFRRIEFYLANCDLSIRHSEILKNDSEKTQQESDAFHKASIASELAEDKFDNLFRYAQRRCERLKNNNMEQTFEG